MSRVDLKLFKCRYKKVTALPSDRFHSVVLAKDTQNSSAVAVNLINRGGVVGKDALQQVLHHLSLHHSCLVNLRQVLLNPMRLGVVINFAFGGNLWDYVSTRTFLPEDLARWMFQQIIAGLDHLQGLGIPCRNLQLENVLLDCSDPPFIKLCNFGACKDSLLHLATSKNQSQNVYMAPEALRRGRCNLLDEKIADVWSCGVILLFMVRGIPGGLKREVHSSDQEGVARIQGLYPNDSLPETPVLSNDVEDLLGSLLEDDPQKRASLPKLSRHPWFKLHPSEWIGNELISMTSRPIQSEAEVLSIFKEAHIRIAKEKQE